MIYLKLWALFSRGSYKFYYTIIWCKRNTCSSRKRLRLRDLGLKQEIPYFISGTFSDIKLYQGIIPAMILLEMTISSTQQNGSLSRCPWKVSSMIINTFMSLPEEIPMAGTFSTTLHLHTTITGNGMQTLINSMKKQDSTMASGPPIYRNYAFYQN